MMKFPTEWNNKKQTNVPNHQPVIISDIWRFPAMEVPPTAGWFISWKILFKWDGFGVALFQETSFLWAP